VKSGSKSETEEEKLRIKALRSLVSKTLKESESPKKKRKIDLDELLNTVKEASKKSKKAAKKPESESAKKRRKKDSSSSESSSSESEEEVKNTSKAKTKKVRSKRAGSSD